MVQVIYKGSAMMQVNGYKIVKGYNEIKDDDFYNMMKMESFRSRIYKKILEVPKDFPLDKPAPKKADSPDSSAQKADESEDDEKTNSLSVKATLKLIEKSEDKDFLQSLIDTDGRSKVVEQAKKKLENLGG